MKIVLTVGAPGSGKSFYAEKIARYNRAFIRLNADTLRGIVGKDDSDQDVNGLVFKILPVMGEYLLKQGNSLIIDNCNISTKARKVWIKLAKKYKIPCDAWVFRTPIEQCLERNSWRERKVPEHVIHNMFAGWQEPTIAEGLDYLLDIRS